jgi:hypothetical protein
MSLTNSPFWMAQTGGASFYDYEIENSFRLDKDSDHYLSRTPASAGNRQKWTLSWWMKRGKIYDGQTLFAWGNFSQNFIFTISGYAGDNSFDYYDYDNGTDRSSVSWSYKVRDPSAWYHMVLRVDTTEGTASNRIRLYINNQQASDSGGRTNYPSQNISMFANNNTPTYIAHDFYGGRGDGYYADVNFIDGQSLDPTSFAETKSGVWVPKEYTGSYGTNGYFLKFQNSAALGTDSSGNSNNFTVNNASSIDQMPDSPTNNFITFNPLAQNRNGTSFFGRGTLSEGNLITTNNSDNEGSTITFAPASGKWYVEFCAKNLAQRQTITAFGNDGYNFASTYVATRSDGGENATGDQSWTTGDIIGVAYDFDNGKVWFAKNNTWYNSSNPATNTGGDAMSALYGFGVHQVSGSTGNAQTVFNAGQDSSFAGTKTAQNNTDANGVGDFYYTPPSGFLALCTANLPAPAIDPAADDTPADYFNTVLYTGANPNAAQSVTGVGFQPDFLWIKSRVTGYGHALQDVVRGATGRLQSNTTGAESISSTYVSSFDSDGFSLGVDYGQNAPSEPYAAWNWKAGGTGVSNTDGSITSTVSANTGAGFSVVTYTGNGTNTSTIGHGLSSAPEFVIVKSRSNSRNWVVEHNQGKGMYLNLNNDGASAGSNTMTQQASTIRFDVSNDSNRSVNFSGETYVAYCFHSVDGFSKIGSYIGNGSSDGAFIYTGFRPAFIIMKRYDASANWIMVDNRRIGYNDNNYDLSPDQTIAEEDNNRLDIVSNGFKFRSSYGTGNASGGTYIYLAFAENPFKYANAR